MQDEIHLPQILGEGDLRRVLELLDWADDVGLLSRFRGARGSSRSLQQNKRIRVKNTEAEEIPSFGCMEVHEFGQDESQGAGAQDHYVHVRKPSGSGSKYLLNGREPIAQNGYGIAQVAPTQYALKETGTAAATFGGTWGPVSGQWYLASTGDFYVLGDAPQVFPVGDVIQVMPPQGAGAQWKWFRLLEDVTGVGDWWAQEVNSANVLVSPANLIEIANWGTSGVITGTLAGWYGLFTLIDGKWHFVQSDQCLPDQCFSNGSISVPTVTATEGVAIGFPFSLTASGLEPDSLVVGALPAGLIYSTSSPTENGGSISGTPAPGTAGTHIVQVSGESAKTGPGTSPTGNCTITKVMVITIAEAA